MAGIDGDVDMSPPTTPTRASSVPFPPSSTPTNRSRTTRFMNINLDKPIRYSSEALYDPEDPLTSPVVMTSNKPKGNTTKFTEDVFDELRDAIVTVINQNA